MKTTTRVAAVALALVAFTRPATAQDAQAYCESSALTWGVGPTVVPGYDFWSHLGGRARAAYCATGHDTSRAFPFSYTVSFDGNYLLVANGVQIPEDTEVRAGGGISLSLSKPEADAPDTLDPDALATWDGGGYNLGFLELGLTGAYEASANRTEHHLSGGVEGRYAINATGWAMLVPSIVARYEWVEPLSSDARDAAAIPDDGDGHSRLTLRGYVNLRPGYVLPDLGNFSLRVDASLFRAYGLEDALETAGWDSGEYLDLTLSFDKRLGFDAVAITSIYVGFATGQLPTDFDGREALSGGVTLALGG